MRQFDNRGSAVVEASLLMPVFIFAMVTLYHIMQSFFAENIVYEACVETVEYMAEYAYLSTDNALLPNMKFEDYVDDKNLVEKYVVGGVDGVSFDGTITLDEDGYVILSVNYEIAIPSILLPGLTKQKSFVLRQKAYLGDINGAGDEPDDGDRYVYITDYQSVYHNKRGCSHLLLSKHEVTGNTADIMKYKPCEFCGAYGNKYDRVIVTDYGDCYHTDDNCSGLKRTIRRVKLSEVYGLGECKRCGY